jgi:hypothetical protein
MAVATITLNKTFFEALSAVVNSHHSLVYTRLHFHHRRIFTRMLRTQEYTYGTFYMSSKDGVNCGEGLQRSQCATNIGAPSRRKSGSADCALIRCGSPCPIEAVLGPCKPPVQSLIEASRGLRRRKAENADTKYERDHVLRGDQTRH